LNSLVCTGAIGKALLLDLLESGTFKTVIAVGRREFEYDGPNKGALVCSIRLAIIIVNLFLKKINE
jgi:hypothetical protein